MSERELKTKADSFDAVWDVCVELGMKVHPPGPDEDGEYIPEESAFQFAFLRGLKEDAERLKAERAVLAKAIVEAAVRVGVTNGKMDLTGPQVLHLLECVGDEVERLEAELAAASSHVEGAIAMRTKFDGNPPYVGWKGLGLAVKEAFDERDAALHVLGRIVADLPTNRDWLDPDVERAANALLRESP